MKLLLDSHTFLWFVSGDAYLASAARAAIEDDITKVRELRYRLGSRDKNQPRQVEAARRLSRPLSYRALSQWLSRAPLNFQHFETLLSLPMHHRDPFDRLLVAQAQSEGMTLVSRDPHFAAYGVPLLW